MPPDLAAQLYAIPANVTQIPASLKQALRGVQDAIVVTCPMADGAAQEDQGALAANAAPTNALDAIGALDAGELSTGQITNAAPSVPATAAPVPFPYPIRPSSSATPAAPPLAGNYVSASSVPHPASDTPTNLSGAQERSQPLASSQETSSGRRMQAQPLGVAPAEPGFALPRTGFLGWLADQQRDFYQDLVERLSRIKSDGTAFWILGGISFLYGVFHAAGPGHGKLVISSYVLANENQVRRGILLSFLSAMVQSAVAVLFVLVAAMAFRMTALAMSDAVNWIGLLSYVTIALLGLWLLVRAIFGTGHRHDHRDSVAPVPAGENAYVVASHHQDEHSAHGHVHEHGSPDGDHHHHHVITPQQTGGSWRQQAAMVVGVGLRPCSGALIVLVFALSQGMFAVGVAAVFLMGLGTALTVGALATLASTAKSLSGQLLLPRAPWLAAGGRMVEALGAFVVLGFGVTMVIASI